MGKERGDNVDVNSYQLSRYFILVMYVWVIAQAAIFGGVRQFLIFFTWWTVFIGVYSVWLSLQAVHDYNFEKKPAEMAKHHIFYTASIISNFIVTTIYWPLLHHHCLAKWAHDEM